MEFTEKRIELMMSKKQKADINAFYMEKMATMLDDKLPAFQKYLLEKNLVPVQNVPFFALWVSRFLDYARKNELSALEYQETAVLEFLESLKIEMVKF